MTRASLQLRLALAGGIVLLLTLAAAQMGLSTLFTRHAERAIAADLSDLSDYLVAAVEPAGDGSLTLERPPADPAYQRPFSGRYWLVTAGGQDFASRSLWDFTLTLPEAPSPGADVLLTLAGPKGTRLLALDRSVIRPTPAGDRTLRIITALDRARIDAAEQAFRHEMLPWLAALGLLILAAGAVQIRVGLAPLATLGQRLAALAQGRVDRIGTEVPAELRPLARQIDALLDDRATEIERSRRRAADLAHGLKTPLQALLGDAAQLRTQGLHMQAGGIETVVRSIHLQVERELARASMAGATPGSAADVARCLQGVAAVVRRTPRGATLDWQINPPAGLHARMDAADLTEALGALVENAAAHARGTVHLTARREGGEALVMVRDDGPGLPPDQIDRLRLRGQRLDTSGNGSGLGLSIADELVVAAGGSVSFENSAQGLCVTIRLPAA